MNILVNDIETLKKLFLNVYFSPEEGKYYKFEISKWKNDIYAMVRFIENHSDYYIVTYNGLSFDAQVIEWILRSYENWHFLSGEEIAEMICQYAQDRISDSNYEIFPPYREENLTLKQVDLFKIWHFDNKNRRVSLKRLEFEMDMENIEEMPIPFNKKNLTREEAVIVIKYCYNDVLSTYRFYLITIGETENSLYKDDNKIELRESLEEEFGIKCLNYSNAKIGDEIIKKFYCEEKHISYQQLPKKGFFRKSIALKYCIVKNISFKTKQLKDFLARIKKITLATDQDFIESIEFYGQTYTFAKGGLHNVINGKVYEATEDVLIKDLDVSGYYPANIINNSWYPFHLGKEFLVGFRKPFERRIGLKPLAKKDKKIKGIVAGLKEAGNCPYGKSSDMTSWLYDKQMTIATCITGELSLLMLIEDCELAGIKCIMANTDGVTVLLPKDKMEVYEAIKKDWLIKTTNNLTYTLEETDYTKMVFSTVNDYLAIKTDGEVKCKGDFMKDFELHKNKSARICPIALEAYYTKGIPVEETIRNHKNIYDFTLRQKASKDFHYEGISTGEKKIYRQLIRYYISNTGEKLLKIKNPECTTNAAKVSQVHAGEWLATICNYLPKNYKAENINYNYYIQRVNMIINKIKYQGKKHKQEDLRQLKLWE